MGFFVIELKFAQLSESSEPRNNTDKIADRFWDVEINVTWRFAENLNIKLKTNLKVKCDHRSKFSNLSNWKEEA